MAYFSIITATYNAENGIERTMKSIMDQSFTDYEIIVKDACSKDRTLELILKNDKIHVYCEKDKGIYDGMNVGISYASGKYLIFMNSGDVFQSDDVLATVYEETQDLDEYSVVYGDYERKGTYYVQPASMSRFTIYRRGLCHQSIFFGRGLFDRFGLYDLRYPIKADYEYLVRMVMADVTFRHIDKCICIYEGDGVSEKKKRLNEEEEKQIYRQYFSTKERIKYTLILKLSMQKLRIYLASDKAPVFLHRMYMGISYRMNGKN